MVLENSNPKFSHDSRVGAVTFKKLRIMCI